MAILHTEQLHYPLIFDPLETLCPCIGKIRVSEYTGIFSSSSSRQIIFIVCSVLDLYLHPHLTLNLTLFHQ